MDGGLLGGRRRAVDADVLGDEVSYQVLVRPFAGGDQTARAGVADLGVPWFAVGVQRVPDAVALGLGDIGEFLREAFVEGLAAQLLGEGESSRSTARGRSGGEYPRSRGSSTSSATRVSDASSSPSSSCTSEPSGWYTSSPRALSRSMSSIVLPRPRSANPRGEALPVPGSGSPAAAGGSTVR